MFNDVVEEQMKEGEVEEGGRNHMHFDILEDSQFYIPMMRWRSEYSHPLMLSNSTRVSFPKSEVRSDDVSTVDERNA